MSGRYRTERLCRHWSQNNNGACKLCTTPDGQAVIEDISHILLLCPALSEARQHVLSIWNNNLPQKPISHSIVTHLWQNPAEEMCQFLLDCSSVPIVIEATQEHGPQIQQDLFYLTRLWVYSVHRRRQQLLDILKC